jgi:tRNA (cmo5U34)-methyltransferase
VSQFHFHPDTYLEKVRAEVPLYDELQQLVASATAAVEAHLVLDLGTGTGETLARVLPRHPAASAVGLDESGAMLAAARVRLREFAVTLVVADLGDPLPPGSFDLVTSVLAIHHLDGPGKAALFQRVAGALRPGGRFVLGDLVIPTGSAVEVTPITDAYDTPSTVAEQLRWLEEAGLAAALPWQQDDLAVFTADRAADRAADHPPAPR